MFKISVCTVLLTISSLSLSAAQMDDFDDFSALLESESNIATKKSMNVDYLPSVVTVIDAQTYIDAGIQNIGQALDVLPGIQMQLSPLGYSMTTVRGFKNPNAYLSDKIKIMVDGVSIYNEVAGSSNFYMDFPMLLVDKIEVLRGPGSTIYGAGAFYATVNIITKMGNDNSENSIYLGTGSYEFVSGGANAHVTVGEWKLYSDGYYQQNDKALYVASKDRSTDEELKDFSVSFKASNGGFEFLTRYKHSESGNFYGFEGGVEPIQDKEHINSYFFSQLAYKSNFSGYSLETKASFSHREFDQGAVLNGSIGNISEYFSKVDVDMQEGLSYRENTHEQNIEAEAILTLPTYAKNDMLFGVGGRRVSITHDAFESSVESAIAQNLDQIVNHENYDEFRYNADSESAYWSNPTTSLLKDNLSRDIVYGYFQDLISVSDTIDFVLGLRLDDYSDFGTQFSKRAALVYRANDELIFKLLYGSAFRAPTLIEAYANGHINFRAGDENLKPEETNTYEAVAIYMPNFMNKFSVNAFYSILDNVIDLEEFPNTDPGYQNYKERISKGVEFEYYFRTKTSHNLYLNATYMDTEYTVPADDDSADVIDQSMPDISKVMLKGLYIYKPTTSLSFGTLWRYFSETTATELEWIKNNDSKDSTLSEVHIFDETITYRVSAATTLRLTVKNLFDADVRQPSYYYRDPGGISREGRHFFASFEQVF